MQFHDISYLKNGTRRQQEVYTVLHQNKILETLQAFNPVLVGTIPINVDIENSDLDIICCFEDKNLFRDTILNLFKTSQDFSIREREGEEETIIAGFYADGFMVELFGQHIPCWQQSGYRHLLIEHRLLNKYGNTFREKVIALKNQGYKTEPAFAKLLGLQGDPYQALLQLEVDAEEQLNNTNAY
ncbi:DUF4269 domain-containing protein [Niabella hibiscisoli]|uniref:DUF4269 domain-containing protein n=1 Tax=Niabella hibiscisoli TaxID=1825928 RepID=UPI001F0E692F|nr:DUF4269 domain-containing protein [Niabella hibiscisoli]MCH5716228.1 DUF4269 domain-containing protein [Niabella hibiscisoli]